MSLIVGVFDKGLGLSSDAAKKSLSDIAESDLVLKSKWELGKIRLTYLNKAKYSRVVLVGLGDELQNATKVDLTSQDQIESEILTPSPQQKYKQNNKIKLEEQFAHDHGDWSFVIAEKIRESVQEAVKSLTKEDRKSTHEIFVDALLAGEKFEQQVVEGAFLGTYEFKLPDSAQYDVTDEEEKPLVILPLTGEESSTWKRAKVYAQSQVVAALVSEMPANLMTPTIFAETMRDHFKGIKNVKVEIHDKKWASDLEMNSFLTVAKGSVEEPRVLEVTYTGNPSSKEIDLVLIGKGITFDAGGISLKPAPGMKDMKGDMGGAATTISALLGITQLEMPLNVVGLAFLCENMPGGNAVKPGDVIRAMNKKSIEIDNTDAEGRLILADALCYASNKRPNMIIDCATLTGAVVVALGHAASGVYTSSNELWHMIDLAGQKSNDYMWRMPLFKAHYLKQLKSGVAKLNNIGGREGGSCTAATFLSEFVDLDKVNHWAHIDIAGTSMGKEGQTGRPTRALIEFATLLKK